MTRAILLSLVILTAACQKRESVAQQAAEPEPHPESYTNWTTKTELFAEYPPLIAGRTSRFAVHLTRLDSFKPVARGKVEIRLTSPEGKVESFSADGPSRPGIFGVDVKPSSAGEFNLSIHLISNGLADVHELASTGPELVKIATVAYQEGEIGILQLLDAYRTQRQAQLRMLEIQAAVKEAQIELERAVGEELGK